MKTFDVTYLIEIFPVVLRGLGKTLEITVISYLLGLVLGLLLALIYRRRPRVLYPLAQVYVSFFRAAPIIALMFFIYFGLPRLLPIFGRMNAFTAAVITISLNISSYMSETIRSSIDAVGRGQIEAGLSVGMTDRQVFTRIVLPQAGKIALPSLSNNLIITLKGTAVAFTIGVAELMGKAKIEASNTYRYFECYAVAILIYWALVLIITFFQRLWEKRLSKAYE